MNVIRASHLFLSSCALVALVAVGCSAPAAQSQSQMPMHGNPCGTMHESDAGTASNTTVATNTNTADASTGSSPLDDMCTPPTGTSPAIPTPTAAQTACQTDSDCELVNFSCCPSCNGRDALSVTHAAANEMRPIRALWGRFHCPVRCERTGDTISVRGVVCMESECESRPVAKCVARVCKVGI